MKTEAHEIATARAMEQFENLRKLVTEKGAVNDRYKVQNKEYLIEISDGRFTQVAVSFAHFNLSGKKDAGEDPGLKIFGSKSKDPMCFLAVERAGTVCWQRTAQPHIFCTEDVADYIDSLYS